MKSNRRKVQSANAKEGVKKSPAKTPKPENLPSGYLDSQSFDKKKYDRNWLVQDILMSKQAMVIGGPKKSLKTGIAIDLAISLGSGKPFLGRFRVPAQVRVAVLSGESGAPVLQETARRIAISKGTTLPECDVVWSHRLPRLDKVEERKSLKQSLEQIQAKVAIIDPIYLCLLSAGKGASASNLFEVGPVLMRAARACLDAGATPVLVHHTNKSSTAKSRIPELGDLAFAGIGEFARQWLLLTRSEPFVPGTGKHTLTMSVGGSAGHSGLWTLRIKEGSLNQDMAGRKWDVDVGVGDKTEELTGARRWRRELA